MQKYKIISDSSCDIPEELTKSLEIDLVPYYVSFDTIKYYKEIEEIKPKDFYDKIVLEKLFPKTSLPPIQDYIDIFEKYLSNDIDVLCMCLSAKFSGSYQSAHNAKSILLEKYPNRRIEIVDTMQATGGQGLVVYEASLMQKNGYTLDMVIEKIELVKKTARINFTVDSLEHLQRGGRIGKAGALAGTILNIKPIIVMENGELVPEGKVRGHKKAIKEIITKTAREINGNAHKFHICVIKSHRNNDALTIAEILKNDYQIDILQPIFDIGVTIGTHAGPTALGICYIQKYDTI